MGKKMVEFTCARLLEISSFQENFFLKRLFIEKVGNL